MMTDLKNTILLVAGFLFLAFQALAQDEKEIPANVIQNQKCFKCHGGKFYSFFNESQGKQVKERMNPYFVFDSATFYISNHKTFVCTDCHSSDYENFPHDGKLRMDAKFMCMDCHGGDETYAKFNFEGIESEFHQSVHSNRHDESFTCWMCHNPHSYKISARNTENLTLTIAYDNAICLNCHGNIDNYQMLTEKENPNVLVTHDWLPNQKAHFANVRCIECHAQTNDSLLVAHLILPKEQAVKKCVECHQSNSILMASLYKFQSQERRNKAGFFNAALMNDSYVIGENRNIYLNIISVVIFGFVILGITIHSIIRILKK
jgi:hypothetical protein